jgi:sterol desaturase/sphingolipid hydroxylase (fatty acid hydroxylase superfamily)
MRSLITTLFYPATLCASVLATGWMYSAGLAPSNILVLNALGFGALICITEFIHPHEPRWRPGRKEVGVDLLHATLSNSIPAAIFKALFFGLAVSASSSLSQAFGFMLWPSDWPLAGQFVLALFVAELGFYLPHRLCHITRLWPLHALHHSVERMYVLAAARTHPLQVFLTYGCQMAILWLMGAPELILVLHAAFTTTHGVLQHANIEMRFGLLNYVLATPELHRWHHSRIAEESNSNYGSNVITWDLIFRTRYCPIGRTPSTDIGLPAGIEIPINYLAHLKVPFAWSRIAPDP